VRTVDSGANVQRRRPGGRSLTRLRDLPGAIARLTGAAAERAARLVEVSVVSGATEPPAELEQWLIETFGSVEAVRTQTIVKVANPVTLEATLFAPLRMRRPIDGPAQADDLNAQIAATEGDPFCDPESGTPAEATGRVRGMRVITGANAAMADAHHAVIVFDAHDPLAFDAELVTDVLRTGRSWAERAREVDAGSVNYLLIWNCLWRAGGSIVHGHAQALLGSGRHYARIERLRRDVAAYAGATPGGDLVEELVAVHRSLGLTIELADGVTLVANLTPVKERELLVVGTAGMEETDARFADGLARTLEAYRDRVGVRSFNLALWRRPLGGATVGWELVPPIARIVDRGDLGQRPSDIGAMELYATPIVGSDPFELIEALR
jgi:hypothetical protein